MEMGRSEQNKKSFDTEINTSSWTKLIRSRTTKEWMGRSNLMTQSKAIQFDLCETEGDWLKKVTNNEESGVHE